MASVPMKPEYGPTLGQLLAPRWRAASTFGRWAVIASGPGLLLVILLAALTLENSTFSHSGRVPFSFSYRGLYRVAPDPGGYVKIQRRGSHGLLMDSLAVDPLRLPPYSGEPSGELPLYAAGYIRGLHQRYPGFVLRGEGKATVNMALGYAIFYTAVSEGRTMWGRDTLLLPERPGAREGVDIEMLTSPTANSQVKLPTEVAFSGVLTRPLKTFTIG
jgi:hypothetical protein